MMSLIMVNKNDIDIGAPLPWPLYDRNHNLVLDRGSVVRDNAQRDKLLANGAYRGQPGVSGEDDVSFFADEEAHSGQLKEEGTGARFTFDDMKLKVEDRLQLQPPAQLSSERFMVKVIGYLRGGSLLVTAPIAANGLRLQIREGEKVIMRSFSGQNAFAFSCKVAHVNNIPYEYLHLSFPDDIQGIMIRKAPRVRTRIIASVQSVGPGSAGGHVSALISNISANGLALDAKRPLGSKGDTLNLTFRVHLHHIDALLSVKGVICAVLDSSSANAPPSGLVRHGIEFQDLQANDCVILQSLIYQQIIENPHQLM